MPTKLRRENIFIERFLSAYENFSWADAKIDWLDERIDGAVEALAIRKSDGNTLAIEHTLIQPFVGEKADFASFEAAFLKIEEDTALPVPGRWIQVFIPVGTLPGKRERATRDAIVESVHSWLKENRLLLPNGFSDHVCAVSTVTSQTFNVTIYTKVISLHGPGKLHVRRQQTESNLDAVIEKALKTKLPKLVQKDAGRRMLFLERQHMILHPSDMLAQIDKQASIFPDLKLIEIWILETMFFEREGYLRFEHYREGALISSLDFCGPKLLDKVEHGVLVLGDDPR